jgi:carbonic anhydrase
LDAIEELIAGYRRFRNGYYRANEERLTALATEGQSPAVAIVGCCDSRVDPAVITDSAPGDLFVIRNVANLVPPCEGEGNWHGTSAALEFAVTGLEVEHLIVLGHARCGGIRALLEDNAPTGDGHFIAHWMQIADSARQVALEAADPRSMDERARLCELESIKISLTNLASFPWIQKRLEQGRLKLHGWYYDMKSGELLFLDQRDNRYKPL